MAIKTGIEEGIRVGIRTGVGPIYTVPKAAEAEFSRPIATFTRPSADELPTALGIPAAVPVAVWKCDETSGINLADSRGNAALTGALAASVVVGAPAYGLNGGAGTMVDLKAVETIREVTTGRFAAATSSLLDFPSGSVGLLMVMRFAGTIVNQRGVAGKLDTTMIGVGTPVGYGVEVLQGGTPYIRISDGGATVNHSPTSHVLADGAWHYVAVVWDRTANLSRCITDVAAADTTSIATITGSIYAPYQTFALGMPRTNMVAAGTQFAYAALFTGSAAEALNDKTALDAWWLNQTHNTPDGWTYTRASTLGCQIGIAGTTGSITKVAGGNGWNAGASSVQKITADGYVEFTLVAGSDVLVGLSADDPSSNYNTVDFGATGQVATGLLAVYENGNIAYGPPGTEAWTAGDVIRIQRSGSTITYKKNGTTYFTSVSSSTGDLYVDTSIFTSNGTISGITLVTGSSTSVPLSWTNITGSSVDTGESDRVHVWGTSKFALGYGQNLPGSKLGAMCSPAVTNLLPVSDVGMHSGITHAASLNNTLWGLSGSFTINYGTGPRGIKNSVRLQKTGSQDKITDAVALTSGTQYCFSIYTRSTSSAPFLRVMNDSRTTVMYAETSRSDGLPVVPDSGWHQIYMRYTPSSSSLYRFEALPSEHSSSVGDCEFQYGQVNTGPSPLPIAFTIGASAATAKTVLKRPLTLNERRGLGRCGALSASAQPHTRVSTGTGIQYIAVVGMDESTNARMKTLGVNAATFGFCSVFNDAGSNVDQALTPAIADIAGTADWIAQWDDRGIRGTTSQIHARGGSTEAGDAGPFSGISDPVNLYVGSRTATIDQFVGPIQKVILYRDPPEDV